jgi:hypothetical protein
MIRKLTEQDVLNIKLQPQQDAGRDRILMMAQNNLLDEGYCYFEGDKVKALVGAQPYWEGRVCVWGLIGDVDNWITFHREVLNVMEKYMLRTKVNRLEMTTELGFLAAERWAKMLGFKYESLMLKFGIKGESHKMWVIV